MFVENPSLLIWKPTNARVWNFKRMNYHAGMPIISEKWMDITNYCSRYYLNETLKHTYMPIIHPICTADSFGIPEEVAKKIISRSAQKTKVGKPRATRYKTIHEKLKDLRCGMCKQCNHNRRTCINMPVDDV